MKCIKSIIQFFRPHKLYCSTCKCELGNRIFIGDKGIYCFKHMLDERIDERLEEFKKELTK